MRLMWQFDPTCDCRKLLVQPFEALHNGRRVKISIDEAGAQSFGLSARSSGDAWSYLRLRGARRGLEVATDVDIETELPEALDVGPPQGECSAAGAHEPLEMGRGRNPHHLQLYPSDRKTAPLKRADRRMRLRIAPEVDSLLQFLDGLGDAVEVGVDRKGAAVTFDRLAQPAEVRVAVAHAGPGAEV